MAVMMFKKGSPDIRVEIWEMPGYESNGWSIEEPSDDIPVVETKKTVDNNETDDDELENARVAYFKKFGERPHHKMKLETILDKLDGNESV